MASPGVPNDEAKKQPLCFPLFMFTHDKALASFSYLLCMPKLDIIAAGSSIAEDNSFTT